MYGLLGEKLGHSFSKEIHESINDYTYNLIEVSKENLNCFMENKNFKAINVTIPYKEMVIPYLYYIDPKAKEIGAVNTIINKDNLLYGYNTDYLGLRQLIFKNNIDFKNKKVLILGNGGTSKTAFVLSNDLGCSKVIKVSRKTSKNTITYDEAKTLYNDVSAPSCHFESQIAVSALFFSTYFSISCMMIRPFVSELGIVKIIR